MAQYSTALLVGRFQPFHKGHLYLLRTALEVADTVVIALGSSNVIDEKNPLSFETRVAMIEKVIVQEGLLHRVRKVVASPDHPSDEVWLQTLLDNVGAFDIALGNNDWVNNVLAQAGYTTMNIPDLERELYQGTHIRKLFAQDGAWADRIPEYLHDLVEPELAAQRVL